MKVLSVLGFVSIISGCAIYSHETMVSTYVVEGGLEYYQKGKHSDNSYFYDVLVWEKSAGSGDLHTYQTNTPELRMKTANLLLKSKYHTGCESLDFVEEKSYEDNEQSKRWLRGTWWNVKVICHNPSDPKLDKYS
ncbi:hypothetical protein [Colwellia piezophila]|uniref:hypothetical protein n=1 Tax=Colwellia piezophila TaxID=211668 RepID=UPI00035D532F|nr:hypothetical protein [Colwellia piezophila]